MADAHANFATSLVATAPSPATSGTSLVVTAGEGTRFPSVPFNATVCPAGSDPTPANAEIVRVTARSTDTLTITRTQESTSARTVVVGDRIFAGATAKSLTDIETVDAAVATGSLRTLSRSATAALPGNDADCIWLPRHYTDGTNTLLAWTHDIGLVNGQVAIAAGIMTLTRLWVPRTVTVTRLVAWLSATGSSPTNSFLALYDSTGTRLGVTADLSTTGTGNWATAGMRAAPINGGAVSVTGGEDVFVWVGFLTGGGTPPTFKRFSWAAAGDGNVGLAATAARAGSYSSGLTSTPSPMTLGTITSSGLSGQLWAGLS